MTAAAVIGSLVTSTVGVASGLAEAPTDRSKVLPVHPELAGLFAWRGLRRGSTVALRGSASLLLAVLAEVTANGSWAAVVGMPNLGLAAAAEYGVALERLALVPYPGAQAGLVIAALLDGVDLVAVATGVGPANARRLSTRARHRGCVLMPYSTPWPAPDLELCCEKSAWTGLGAGHGHLRQRAVEVRVGGRGTAARPVGTTLLLPAPGGAVRSVAPAADPRCEPRERRLGATSTG